MREDGRGLFVRGLVTDETAAGAAALQLIGEGELSADQGIGSFRRHQKLLIGPT